MTSLEGIEKLLLHSSLNGLRLHLVNPMTAENILNLLIIVDALGALKIHQLPGKIVVVSPQILDRVSRLHPKSPISQQLLIALETFGLIHVLK